MPESDLNLIYKIVFQNDHGSYGKLIDKYQAQIHGLFYKLTNGDIELVNDLSQEVFIKVFKHLRGYKGNAKFSTWLYRISVNVYYDYKKSIRHNSRLENDIPVFEIESSDAKMDIKKALQILSENERIAILLSYEQGFSHNEIHKIMKLPLGTVKSLILRGKLKLKEFYNYE